MSPSEHLDRPANEDEHALEETVEINSLLGKGSRFEGKLVFTGAARIDGEFSGQIEGDDILVVGEGSIVKAEISVGALIIEGTCEGNITASRSVEVLTPAIVRGDITTPSLYIDRGVLFEGQCHMPIAAPPAAPGDGARVGAVHDSDSI